MVPRISHITFLCRWLDPASRRLTYGTPHLFNGVGGLGRSLVLPHVHDRPSHQFELGVLLSIPLHVALKLR